MFMEVKAMVGLQHLIKGRCSALLKRRANYATTRAGYEDALLHP